MGKSFLNLNIEEKKAGRAIFGIGCLLAIGMGVKAWGNMELQNGYELPRNRAGEGAYEQEVIAEVDGYGKIPLTILVEEQRLSEREAKNELEKAAEILDETVIGKNEALDQITDDLVFADLVPGTCVEVQWVEKASEYFSSDGTRRSDREVSEPVEEKISAILSCQEYDRDYEKIITIQPIEPKEGNGILEMIEAQTKENAEDPVMTLPKEYNGKKIYWKKPIDLTFLYVMLFFSAAALFLKAGKKRDEKKEREIRLEQFEMDYAQIVSKFTMLLSAGMSIRNAWERIVKLYGRKAKQQREIYEEMHRSLCELEKGISEIQVYENFGSRIGQVHYKKLMSLFISDKKRGSIRLLDAMNQEMLQAWEERKRKARQRGEKIGTKLLFPMLGMLGAIFLMILVPAFLSFQL